MKGRILSLCNRIERHVGFGIDIIDYGKMFSKYKDKTFPSPIEKSLPNPY